MEMRQIKPCPKLAHRGLPALGILMGLLMLAGLFLAVPLQAQWITTVDVGYGSTPTIDGAISQGEYLGAASLEFPCYGGTCQASVGHDTANLYIAFDLPDTTPYPHDSQGGTGPAVQVFLDTDKDRAGSPQSDDFRLTVTKGNDHTESQGLDGDPGRWRGVTPTGWAGAVFTQTHGWQAEFSVEFSKLGIVSGTTQTFGLALANVWTKDWPVDHYWPSGGDWHQPDTWGSAFSAAEWESWSFKAGGWIDYAPNGVPDFDQRLAQWGQGSGSAPWQWTYCGPVAAANSLWWFDAKFEPSPVPPPTQDDDYYLVTEYPGSFGDDDRLNVGGMGIPGLVDDLAWYFDTDGLRTGTSRLGTEVHSMTVGLEWFLYGHSQIYPSWSSKYVNRPWSYYDDYHVQLVKMPAWDWVVDKVRRSEDVVLLLGFWHQQESGQWVRLGGHYVTVAGINADEFPPKIALSDPYLDNAEGTGPGRVMTGTIMTPHNPGHTSPVHHDAGNLSHDYYTVTLAATSPAGLWEIEDYSYLACEPAQNFQGQNCPSEYVSFQADTCSGEDPVYVEVEYALAVSPFYWKPGGEWVDTWWKEAWITEFWRYEDDGHSCLPDFQWDDSQDFHYDGPVALANSFWWFDSKAETLLTGGWPTLPEDGAVDHYSLTVAYGAWDDHAVSNTVPFISDLADYLDTGLYGTTITSMTAGINAYLARPGVAGDFYTITKAAPTWEWIADEVETSEDVVLLLGFYEDLGSGWQRKGGHWVNAAGANREGMFVGLSDPAIDHAISETISTTMYLGRVFPPEQRGIPFTQEEKRDPQSISHDIYHLAPHADFADQLLLEDYPFASTSVLSTYVGMNGAGSPVVDWSNPMAAIVEWAVGVSPYSELVISKTASITEVLPGDIVTFTITYANAGLASALKVSILDTMPEGVLNPLAVTSYPPISATEGTPTEATVIWTRPRLSYGQTGTLTLTAQALTTATLTNTAYITGHTGIGRSTPDKNLANNAAKVGPTCARLARTFITGPTSGLEGSHDFGLRLEPVNASELIVYQWDNGDTAPMSFRLLDAGVHTLTVTATNCADALVTDTHTIILTKPACVDMELVEMELISSTPIQIDNPLVFEADIAPDDAAKPFTYTLALDGQEGGRLSSRADPLVFTQTFDTTGTHSVTVAAWNCAMSRAEAVTRTLEVDVLPAPADCVEIETVEMELETGTPIRLGGTATFEADIGPDDSAKPYSYTVALDGLDDAPQSSELDPLTITRTFVTTGTHTVEVSMWNCEMDRTEAVTSSTQVEVVAYQVYLPIVLKLY